MKTKTKKKGKVKFPKTTFPQTLAKRNIERNNSIIKNMFKLLRVHDENLKYTVSFEKAKWIVRKKYSLTEGCLNQILNKEGFRTRGLKGKILFRDQILRSCIALLVAFGAFTSASAQEFVLKERTEKTVQPQDEKITIDGFTVIGGTSKTGSVYFWRKSNSSSKIYKAYQGRKYSKDGQSVMFANKTVFCTKATQEKSGDPQKWKYWVYEQQELPAPDAFGQLHRLVKVYLELK